ncbi:MAG TPA: acylphosphatase [Pyrinomonadaceae bacterium]
MFERVYAQAHTIRIKGFEGMKTARKFLISGEVQKVGYRYFAQRAAARHQVTGYVRNLPDGRVEVVAEGPLESVEGFKHDLAAGPTFSQVENIEEISIEPTGSYSHFRIER